MDSPVCVADDRAEQTVHPLEELVPSAVVNDPAAQNMQLALIAAIAVE
jgi:hypothetical protein